MTAETHVFQTEVQKLLDLMIHSLYTNKNVFLRELISNASDALDRRRFVALTEADLLPDAALEIRLRVDPEARTLEVMASDIIPAVHKELTARGVKDPVVQQSPAMTRVNAA